ncbi:hypothetical protein BOTBODRAFT_181965 [Botryobasidium botryosum FD-172 SS1]|uniref:Uncharacterized protein n=1 Tax=Botryobasidium botryosum (strain FD-172 SS1) TaxID=930990 RepID=A0A067M380_BOTB1|nr:hypothetical protein BOTBODRAFT_181965 [Botryobasidium botryosum FD-172 SS1]
MVLLTDHERELLSMRNIPRKSSAVQPPAATPDPPTPPRPHARGRGLTGRPKSRQSTHASGSASNHASIALPPVPRPTPRVHPTQTSGAASRPTPLPAPRAPPSHCQPAPPIHLNASGKSHHEASPTPSHRSRSTSSGDPQPRRKDIPEQHESVTPKFNIVGPGEILSMPLQVKGRTKARGTHRTAATWWKREVIPKFIEAFPRPEGTDLVEEEKALLNWAKNYKSRQDNCGQDSTFTSRDGPMVFKKPRKPSALELFAQDHKEEVEELRKEKLAEWKEAGDPLAGDGGRAWQTVVKALFEGLTFDEQQEYKSRASAQSTEDIGESVKEKNVEYFAETMNKYLQRLQAHLPWAAISVSAGVLCDAGHVEIFTIDAPPPKFQDFAAWDKKCFDAHRDNFSKYCVQAYNFVQGGSNKTPLDWERLSASPDDFLTPSSLPEDVALQDPEQMDPLEVMSLYRHIYCRQDDNPSVFDFLPQYYAGALAPTDQEIGDLDDIDEALCPHSEPSDDEDSQPRSKEGTDAEESDADEGMSQP